MLLPLLSLLALAGGDDGAPGAQSLTWLDLDAAAQASAEQPDSGALSFGLLLRAFYTTSPKEATAGTEDASGNVFEDLDLYFGFETDDIQWRASADFSSGTMVLEDAYARWHQAEWMTLTMGQFRPRVMRSGSVRDEGLLFRDRTFLGAAFDVHDNGIEIGGHRDQFDYWFALTNSSNGEDTDSFWSARGEWALFDAAGAEVEGARGAPNFLRAVLGAVVFNDGASSANDAGGTGVDLGLTFGPYGFHWEWARLDEQFARTIDVFNGELLTIGDGQPFATTFSRCIGPMGEVAVRYERADDDDHTTSTGGSATWSVPDTAVRLIVDLSRVEADSQDFSLFSIGLSVGSSGPVRRWDSAGGW